MPQRSALSLDPNRYARHEVLHGEQSAWTEKNCYVDVWIEAVHAMGFDPMPMLAPALAIDFEGDQWTFFKPSHADLEVLYGIDVHELQLWRPLVEHVDLHVAEGKLVITEADSFFLPDTRGTEYRTNHVKSSIVIASIDAEARTLGYFHNAGYFALGGEDFDGLFRIGAPPDPTVLPLFAEYARIDRLERRPVADLAAMTLERTRAALRRRPKDNPIARFGDHFAADVDRLKVGGMALYHGYAFATLRQCGASFDLGAHHLAWLAEHANVDTNDAATAFREIAQSCKVLVLKAARAVASKSKSVDFAPILRSMAESWVRGMEGACAKVGG